MSEVKDYFEGKAKDWDSYYDSKKKDLVKFDFIRRKEFVFDMLNFKAKKVLEIGCGPGTFSGEIISKGNKLWGVDISKEMISQAKKKYGKKAKFSTGDITNLDFGDNFFDVVVAVGVVPYVDESVAFKEINRVLKKNGILVVTTNYRYSPNYLSRRFFNMILQFYPSKKSLIFQKIITHAMSENGFRKLAKSTGFQILDRYFCSYKFFPIHKVIPGIFISFTKRRKKRSKLGFLATERIYKLRKVK